MNKGTYLLKPIIIGFVLFLPFKNAFAQQEIILKGQITAKDLKPLAFVNVLAFPKDSLLEPVFAITDQKGNYKLLLVTNQSYHIQASHLGFENYSFDVNLENNTIKNFILEEAIHTLEGVEVTYKIPIQVKKDTTIYNVEVFANGKERKIKELINKLPGLEVDREGNITSNGKEVTTVLVDNKPFFSGNSKLAVNNIPSNVVDQIEIIEDYHRVSILKGLEDSNRMAMNIKLKKNQKKFLFGDVELGFGNTYLVHPSIFYYSPKTNVNFIGDVNNTGVKAFSWKDYLEFEGGYESLLENSTSSLKFLNDDFSQFLSSTDFKKSTQKFGAFHVQQNINPALDISSYIIASKNDDTSEIEINNSYQNVNQTTDEYQQNIAVYDNFFTLGKLNLNYKPSTNEDVSYHSFFKISKNIKEGFLTTISNALHANINTNNNLDAFHLKQNISYNKKWNQKHTGSVVATYLYEKNNPNAMWVTNQRLLKSLIPLRNSNLYRILQTKTTTTHALDGIIKDYWIINNTNHLYFSLGFHANFQNFNNEDKQQLDSGRLYNYADHGFGNDLRYNLIDTYLGLEYKFKLGVFTFRPAVYHHYYYQLFHQNNEKTIKTTNLVLPEFKMDVHFRNSAKISLLYKAQARFAAVDYFASNFRISGFNSVFKGNESLDNALYHNVYAYFSQHNFISGFRINARMNYSKKIRSIKRKSVLEGINSFGTPIVLEMPENSWRFACNLHKRINKIRAKLGLHYTLKQFYQLVNEGVSDNKSNQFKGVVGLKTLHKKGINVEIEYARIRNRYNTTNDYSFTIDDFLGNINYILFKDFEFRGSFNYSLYTNAQNSAKNNYFETKLSLGYQKENSSWGFELEVRNVFDTEFKQNNSFNSFIISDHKTFVMPRTILFKANYKI
ncbi:MAG: TonB-dependent receptor [Flavobacteriaceae bacterium]|nr:TonB-dependent receptor [Flavobacteriaceae bacterium]